MRNLLYLFNNGYRAFPHIGHGGLGYKPPFKIIGDGLHRMVNDKGQEYFIDDGDRTTKYVYDQGFIMDDSETGITGNPYDYIEDGKIEFTYENGVKEYVDVITDPTFKHPNEDDDEEEDDGDEELEEKIITYDMIDFNAIPDKEFNIIGKVLEKYKKPDTKIKHLNNIKGLENFSKNGQTYYNYLIQVLNDELIEKEESKPYTEAYKIPDPEPHIKFDEEELNEIIQYKLEPLDEYKKAIKTINKIEGDNYSSLIFEDLKGYGDEYYDNFSITGGGGVDFEDKVKDKPEFFESILKSVGYGENVKVVEIIPDKSNFDKADFVIRTSDGETIDIEMKKQVANKYKEYNSVEVINAKTKKDFNEWFNAYKSDLIEESEKAKYGKDRNYKELLDAISTNGKIDKSKLRLEYIKSGNYYGLPLTATKFKTPSKEELSEIYGKKYPESKKEIIKYQTQWQRVNKSENKLIPVILVKDAILVMDVKANISDMTPHEIFMLSKNLYGKKTKDALLLPACLYSTLKLSDKLVEEIKNVNVKKVVKTPKPDKGKKAKKSKEIIV